MLSHQTSVHLRHGGIRDVSSNPWDSETKVARSHDSSSASGASFCTPCGRGEFNDQEVQGSCQNCQPGFGDVGC